VGQGKTSQDAHGLQQSLARHIAQDLFNERLAHLARPGAPLSDAIDAAGALIAAGRTDFAQHVYRVWVSANPANPQRFVAWFNCAVLSSNQGDLDAARRELTEAIAVNPDFSAAFVNLGGVLERQGHPAEAMAHWNAVLARLSGLTGASIQCKLTALKQAGRMLGEKQELELAEQAMAESLSLDPADHEVIEQWASIRLTQCKWPAITPLERLDAASAVGGMHPLTAAAYTDDPFFQLALAGAYVEAAVDERPGGASDRRAASIDLKGRRLRVGYVSSDLRDHAVGYLMAELFEVHDREKIEVFAYYCGRPSAAEALHGRIKASVEHWRDIRTLSDDEAAALIAGDEIDILVDVNGHTRDARTAVFARRPAPIQVNWLGFPGTMGTPYHHYVIADDWIAPEGSERWFSERVLRLPCYQPNDRKRKVADQRPSRAQAGLPEDAFVFCCFNGAQKISRFTFERWLRILTGAPGSVLWLLESTPETHERLRAYAEARGVARERIVFAPKMANPAHLARYPLADLFLDTAPYGAHTTASDALWMGVPVLTLSGRSFASRVCGSLVRSAGLPELVCEDPEIYVAEAIALAAEPGRVAGLKARLEAGRGDCVLFDMELLVERLEGLYAEMAQDYREGRLPQPDLTNLPAYLAVAKALDHEAHELLGDPGYEALYRDGLARRHALRPLAADGRLWTGESEPQAKPRTRRTGRA
jgi:predicted O-linked N-acetylglucosamine transferase (SPINDLY family)